MKRSQAPLLVLLAGLIAGLPERQTAAEERAASQTRKPAAGPLRVHPTNPRYFTDGTKTADGAWKAVYLTGSHTWANLIDRGTERPAAGLRLRRIPGLPRRSTTTTSSASGAGTSAGIEKYGERPLHAGPLPWPRTGPGKAPGRQAEVRPDEVRRRLTSTGCGARVSAAGDRGIYVSVMLFGGHQEAGPNWTGNPFHRDNNVNGIDGDPDRDGSGWETQTLAEIPKAVAERPEGLRPQGASTR